MKKNIILSALLSICIGISANVYGQNDLTINNNTGCTYTIDVTFDDGSGNCTTVYGTTIPSSPTTTYIANPYGSGWAAHVDGISCNPCPTLLPVGPTSSTCGGTYPNPTSKVCATCAPNFVQYTWTSAAGGSNAILDIDPL